MSSWVDYQYSSEEEKQKAKRQMRYRRILRRLGRFLGGIMTRMTVTGLENIPENGPVLIAGNHFSTYDAFILAAYLPDKVQFVGPGDFKLLWPANLVVENLGLILAARGSVDRESMKKMDAVLKNGGFLALFPEGGTWEKGIEDVKSGAAYLSMTTGASVVPMAIGGTYQVWKRIFQFKRPKIAVHFGELIPPIEMSGNRKTRQQELQDYSIQLMYKIYDKLPQTDKDLYDIIPRQRFSATLEFLPDVVSFEDLPELAGLSELISKPNLFSPLHKNAGLPLRPFVQRLGKFTPAYEFHEAVLALQKAFENEFKGYLEYRLGDDKAKLIYQDLAAFLPIIEKTVNADAAIKYTVNIRVVDKD